MNAMFEYAKAFNQNLCNWGTYYNSTKTYQLMFSNSGCDVKTDPESENGPWCQDNDSGLCDVIPHPESGQAPLKSTRLLNGQECTNDSECKNGYCDFTYGDIDIDNVGHCAESLIRSTQEAFTGVSFKCLRYILHS